MAEEGDDAQTVAVAPTTELAGDADTISKLAAMTDVELAQALGLSDKLVEAKEQIHEMAKLKGEGREYAESRVSEMLTPKIYDLSYTLEEAQRKNKKKQTGDEARCDCSPSSVL